MLAVPAWREVYDAGRHVLRSPHHALGALGHLARAYGALGAKADCGARSALHLSLEEA